jgi:hypothetical protein
MKKLNKVLGIVAVGACFALSASALQIQIGYSGSEYGPYKTGHGGEFTLSPTGSDALDTSYYFAGAKDFGVSGSIQSFCLEYSEKIYGYPSVYDVAINDYANEGGVSGGTDPLSQGTGWLVKQFATGVWEGSLSYNYGAGRTASAALLQEAIWMLEEEAGWNYNALNVYALAAFTEFGDWDTAKGGFASDYGVKALNLTRVTDGEFRQDQVFYTGKSVPDGGVTVALLGMAMVGLAAMRRRSAKA